MTNEHDKPVSPFGRKKPADSPGADSGTADAYLRRMSGDDTAPPPKLPPAPPKIVPGHKGSDGAAEMLRKMSGAGVPSSPGIPEPHPMSGGKPGDLGKSPYASPGTPKPPPLPADWQQKRKKVADPMGDYLQRMSGEDEEKEEKAQPSKTPQQSFESSFRIKRDEAPDKKDASPMDNYLKKMGLDENTSAAHPPVAEKKKTPPSVFQKSLEGIKLLDDKKFGEALQFYQKMSKDSPQRAEGFVGSAIALFGLEKYVESADSFLLGIQAEPSSPAFPQMFEFDKDNFDGWYIYAQQMLKRERFDWAEEAIQNTMKSKLTPQPLYMKSDQLLKKIRKKAYEQELERRPELKELEKSHKKQGFVAGFLKFLFFLVFCGACYVGYIFYQGISADQHHNKGVEMYFKAYNAYYFEAAKMNDEAKYNLASPHLKKAEKEFKDVISLRPLRYDAHYMLWRTYRELYNMEIDTERYKQYDAEMESFKQKLKSMDPDKIEFDKLDAWYKKRLEEIKTGAILP